MADRTIPDRASPSAKIAQLNDNLRLNISGPSRNKIVITRGIAEIIGDVSIFAGFRRRAEFLSRVRLYDRFSADNDPYGERDFGSFECYDVKCFWKIDYFNLDLTADSEDPSDPTVTIRVLTIMRADEN